MKKLDEQGNTALLISLIATVVLLIGAIVFGVVEAGKAQNYKNNVDSIAAARIKVAVDQNTSTLQNQFDEAQKSPLKTYNGPSAYGSLAVQYPKTWSAYVDTSGSANPVDGYFNPNYVPAAGDNGNTFALRVQVSASSYDSELQQFDGLVQSGSVKVVPYTFPNVKGVVGVKVTGQIEPNTDGTLILVPLRDKSLLVWTETDQHTNDFNKYILPNFKFSP